MTKFKIGDKVIVTQLGAAGLKIGTKATVVEVDSTGVYLDVLNRSGVRSWYRFEAVEKAQSKKAKIKALEKRIAELEAKVAALESTPTTPKTVPVTSDNIEVGDKIRVLSARNISVAYLTDGKIYEVTDVSWDGNFKVIDDEDDDIYIVEDEFRYVEKVVSE